MRYLLIGGFNYLIIQGADVCSACKNPVFQNVSSLLGQKGKFLNKKMEFFGTKKGDRYYLVQKKALLDCFLILRTPSSLFRNRWSLQLDRSKCTFHQVKFNEMVTERY